MDISPYMDEERAAGYLGIAQRTLGNWRFVGRGPKYIRLGRRILYHRQHLDDWALSYAQHPEAKAPVDDVAAGA
jgi:hypothetical protein